MTAPGSSPHGHGATASTDEWSATVVEHHRLRHNMAVVRLESDEPVPFPVGGHVSVAIPSLPGQWRRLSPALPPSLDGKIEFHVRSAPGGWVSTEMVGTTKPGDRWTLADPGGGSLHVEDDDRIVIMIAEGTGLAPMRSLLLDMARRDEPNQTFLFVGDTSPRDLYAADMLTLLGDALPWLTIVPVVESVDDPEIRDPYFDRLAGAVDDLTFDPDLLLEGTLAEVVSSYGAFGNHQVLVCGKPTTVPVVVDALERAGTPRENIRFDPA